MLLAYVVRHGYTAISPQPEDWLPVPLDSLGRVDAMDAAQWIKRMGKVQPEWGISSDLPRAEQTLGVCAKVLGLNVMRPMQELRAFSHKDETPEQFEKRNNKAFTSIMQMAAKSKKVGVIACHRSNTAYLGKMMGGVLQNINYRLHTLVHEGGIVLLNRNSIEPVFKFEGENAKSDLYQPFDGTQLSGFVTAKDNPPPRECGFCRWYDIDHCDHPAVNADDAVGLMYAYRRNPKGKWLTKPSDCCDNFQSTKSLTRK